LRQLGGLLKERPHVHGDELAHARLLAYEFKEEVDIGDTSIEISVAPIDRKSRSQASKREEK